MSREKWREVRGVKNEERVKERGMQNKERKIKEVRIEKWWKIGQD